MWVIPTGTSAALKKKKIQVKSPSIWSLTPNSIWIRQSGRTGNRGVTLTFLVTGFLSNYQHLFKVNAQLSKFINSPNLKFHADKNYF